MKKNFSKSWKSSRQPRKQRKFRAKAPINIKRKFLSANLSKELRKRYQRRSFPLRKQDTVKIMRGYFHGKKGKIAEIDAKRKKVSIEGIQRSKKDGTKVAVYFNPSKLQIQELNLDDRKRIMSLERKIKKQESKSEEKKEIKKEIKKETEKEHQDKTKKQIKEK